ncbi:MAG: hypothetical protein KH135_00095 [Firmicutes bacterium]|nr:hypothetical protein [Bacillota bacterium]
MASRMDRYRESELNNNGMRTKRNEHLYARVEAPLEYSSVEGVARIENTNSVDINKIKELLLKDEEPKKRAIKNSYQEEEEPEEIVPLDDKNYDIRDILNKAKGSKKEDEEDRYRALQNTGYDILKNIQIKNRNTDVSEKELDSVGDTTLSLSMLDSLKGSELTSTIDSNTIRALLESEKEALKEDEDDFEEERTLDNSFFTSSLNFSEDDFNELSDELDEPKKKNHLFLKVILFLILVIGTTAVIFFLANYLK